MKLPNLIAVTERTHWYIYVCKVFLLIFICTFFVFSSQKALFAQSTQCQRQTDAFVFDTTFTTSTLHAGTPFSITIFKCDSNGQIDIGFSDVASLNDTTNSISPQTTSGFVGGVWTGTVTITQTSYPDGITVNNGRINGASNQFVINPGTQTFLAQLEGNAQSGIVSSTLRGALGVKAIDQYGNPVPNIGVNFTIPAYPPSSSGQGVSISSATTDINGKASTQATLGNIIGTYTIAAAIGGGSNIAAGVHFYENASAGPLITLSKSNPINSSPWRDTAFFSYRV